MVDKWTILQKKKMAKQINCLSPTEHLEILKIVDKYNIQYTQNNNGVFINISNLELDLLDEISVFIDFCIKNNKELDEYDKKIQECKNNTILYNNNNVIKSIEDEIIEENDDAIFNYTDSKFTSYVNSRLEAIHNKKNHTKYMNSKKKYSRKSTTCFMDSKKSIDSVIVDYEDTIFK